MNKKSSIFLVAGVYACMLFISVTASLFNFATDSIRFANGTLVTTNFDSQTLPQLNFEFLPNGNMRSITPDPQFIIDNKGMYATKVTFDIAFSRLPGEVNLYYTYGDEDFTDKQKIWGKAKNDGTYEFILPRGKINQIRVDPTSISGVELEIKSFTLNPKAKLTDYFKYTNDEIFKFVIIGVFITCFMAAIADNHPTLYAKFLNQTQKLFKKIKRKN